MKTILLRAAIVLACLYIVLVGAVAWSMRQPPQTFGHIMSRMPTAAFFVLPFETLWLRARAGTLKPGDSAPDFLLVTLDKTTRVQLSSFHSMGKPVVLVFGSYT